MEWWTNAYIWHWADKALLKAAVANDGLTADQYKTITGEDYTA